MLPCAQISLNFPHQNRSPELFTTPACILVRSRSSQTTMINILIYLREDSSSCDSKYQTVSLDSSSVISERYLIRLRRPRMGSLTCGIVLAGRHKPSPKCGLWAAISAAPYMVMLVVAPSGYGTRTPSPGKTRGNAFRRRMPP